MFDLPRYCASRPPASRRWVAGRSRKWDNVPFFVAEKFNPAARFAQGASRSGDTQHIYLKPLILNNFRHDSQGERCATLAKCARCLSCSLAPEINKFAQTTKRSFFQHSGLAQPGEVGGF